ncbi:MULTISPECIES: heterocyst-inhibiting protein PatX [Nostoc cyanobionts]|uniref:heterocyst-inhibiting protein PatX n=1 Tax=Nostoc cyanobionts TaxID=3123326 RepID=UPI000D0C543E|nr:MULTISPECIES: hypothetical protein [unclassified Nostoc]AVH63700.1 hypothetical protein NPM_1926 [Nostoc sp. 'Peltigera membranacea cyanobiont' N6]
MSFTPYTLVGTFVFCFLSLNNQIHTNKLSPTLLITYKTQQLFSEITKSNTPSTPVPYRGGGRRYLIEPFKNIEPLV